LNSTKAIIVTLEDGKEAVSEIQSDLENRVYHKEVTKEAFGGQHIDSQKSFDERKKHQINSYFKDIISTVNESDELYILDLQKQKTNFNKKSTVKNRLLLVS
jgi:hypothetical protein